MDGVIVVTMMKFVWLQFPEMLRDALKGFFYAALISLVIVLLLTSDDLAFRYLSM